jgi:hypothetical protein
VVTEPTVARRRIAASLVAVVTVVLVLAVGAPTPLAAQFPDAWIVPRGVLRISFEPQYTNYGQRFDADGAKEPWGTDFTDAAAGVRLVPTMYSPQIAIRSITADSVYTLNTGAWQTTWEADIRRFPLDLQLGLSNRLTFTASIPLVSTRSQVSFVVDSTNADQGWNQATVEAGNAGASAQIQQLLAELEAGAAFVEGQIAAGDYGCPSSTQCDQARDLVDRTRRLTTDLTVLTGVAQDGSTAEILPPFAPLSSSTAGQTILTVIQATSTELQSFGASGLTTTLPLPGAHLSSDDVNAMFINPALGYDAFPLEFVKYHLKLGDVEVGLRWGAVQRPGLRAVLIGIVRLPTGQRDLANNFVDIGTGDRQPDVVLGAEGSWEPGSVLAVNAEASYTVQLGDNLPRRITPHDRPIAILATQQDVAAAGTDPDRRLGPGVRDLHEQGQRGRGHLLPPDAGTRRPEAAHRSRHRLSLGFQRLGWTDPQVDVGQFVPAAVLATVGRRQRGGCYFATLRFCLRSNSPACCTTTGSRASPSMRAISCTRSSPERTSTSAVATPPLGRLATERW